MERGDIAIGDYISQACVFEDLLAIRPTGAALLKAKFYERNNNWEASLKLWKPGDIALRSLNDYTNRLRIVTEVITFLDQEAVEPIYRWLLRKGVTCPVIYYEKPEDYELDLRYNRSVRTVYVASDEHARILGMRAKVINPTTAWS
jgi:hypothetical protein